MYHATLTTFMCKTRKIARTFQKGVSYWRKYYTKIIFFSSNKYLT